MDDFRIFLNVYPTCVYLPFLKGTSVDERKNENILDRVRLVVSPNDSQPVENIDRLGRSIHYININ